MKTLILLPVFIILLNAKSCEKNGDPQIPTCIQQMIGDYQNRSTKSPSGKFLEYDYAGKKVYLYEPPCCDQISKVYDSNCNLVCTSGGFTGKMDSVCVDFYKTRTNEKLIWEDTNQK